MVKARVSVTGKVIGATRGIIGVGTSAVRVFDEGPQKSGCGSPAIGRTRRFREVEERTNFKTVLTRTPCAVGLTDTGPRICRFTYAIVQRSIAQVSELKVRGLIFRPKDRAKVNTRTKVRGVVTKLSRTVAKGRGVAILLRAVDKGKARVN